MDRLMKRIEFTREFLSNLVIINFDVKAAERSAHILNSLKKLGKPIGIKDTLIAGALWKTKQLF